MIENSKSGTQTRHLLKSDQLQDPTEIILQINQIGVLFNIQKYAAKNGSVENDTNDCLCFIYRRFSCRCRVSLNYSFTLSK